MPSDCGGDDQTTGKQTSRLSNECGEELLDQVAAIDDYD